MRLRERIKKRFEQLSKFQFLYYVGNPPEHQAHTTKMKGTYTIEIDKLSATLTVIEPFPSYWVFAGILMAILIIIAIFWFYYRAK